MAPLYRIEHIVRAFYYVKKQSPSAILLLLDYNKERGYLEKLQKIMREKDLVENVRFFYDMPNPFSGMKSLYAMSSVVVSIPRSDGMPQTIFEAFAAGCPVITSDMKTYDDVIIDRKSGIRVSGSNIIELSEAILELLTDVNLRNRVIWNGKSIVRKRGDIFMEMQKMEKLYFSLLNQAETNSTLQ